MPTKPTKRKVTGGRVTPKAAGPAKVGATPGSLASKARTPIRKTVKPAESPAERKKAADAKAADAKAAGDAVDSAPVRSKTVAGAKTSTPSKRVTERSSGRYTPPAPPAYKVSPWWVPALMFTLIGAGMLVIFLNYLGVFVADGDTPSNVPLVIGLGMILGGIITATQYH